MPFRFLEEIATADVAFEAWGDTLQELFISSAAALLGTMTAAPERVARREELTVRWSTRSWTCCCSHSCRN